MVPASTRTHKYAMRFVLSHAGFDPRFVCVFLMARTGSRLLASRVENFRNGVTVGVTRGAGHSQLGLELWTVARASDTARSAENVPSPAVNTPAVPGTQRTRFSES